MIGLTPTDPGILQKLGTTYDAEGDKQQAYQYHFDSYRYFPSNLETIDWLGSYFIEMQVNPLKQSLNLRGGGIGCNGVIQMVLL